MASAKKKEISGEVLPPDYDEALRIFNADVKPANKTQKQAMQEASAAWKIIKKDHRVNVAGFRLAMKIADMEEAEQQSFLRALRAGLQARHVSLHADLVDNAEGVDTSNVVPIEAARGDARSDLDVPEGGADLDDFDATDPARVAAE